MRLRWGPLSAARPPAAGAWGTARWNGYQLPTGAPDSPWMKPIEVQGTQPPGGGCREAEPPCRSARRSLASRSQCLPTPDFSPGHAVGGSFGPRWACRAVLRLSDRRALPAAGERAHRRPLGGVVRRRKQAVRCLFRQGAAVVRRVRQPVQCRLIPVSLDPDLRPPTGGRGRDGFPSRLRRNLDGVPPCGPRRVPRSRAPEARWRPTDDVRQHVMSQG